MKRLIVAGLVAMLAIFASSVVQAAMDTQQTVAVLVGVTEVFGFDIWATEYTQSDTVLPGEAGMGDIHIGASSNHTVPWNIQASSAGIIGQNHGGVLPVKITIIAGAGTKCADNTNITAAPAVIYTAAATEYPKQGVEVSAMYVVPTTIDTAQDLYAGSIVLTMNE